MTAVLDQNEFAIQPVDEHRRLATREGWRVKIVAAGPGEERLPDKGITMFHRNIRNTAGGAQRWLVAELNGVRVYIDAEAGRVFLSDKDIYSW